jgi:hypothetical protein
MGSTLTFWACLREPPSEQDDLLTMEITRAIVAAVTGIEVWGGIRSGISTREIFYPVHIDRIPQAWLEKAEQLVRQKYITRYEWSGEIEQKKEYGASMTVELEYDGKLYKGVLYAVAQEEEEE